MKAKWKLATLLAVAAVCVGGFTGCVEEIFPDKDGHTCQHEYGEWTTVTDATCTEAGVRERECFKCGKTEASAIAKRGHTGGESTCQSKAKCTVCGEEYGELAAHQGEQIWIKHLNDHRLVYSCCYTQITEAEGHTKVDGVCTTCGFNPSITVSSAEVTSQTSQVTVTVSVTDNPGIAGLMLSLQYNADVLALTEVTSEEAFDALTFTAPSDLDGDCVFVWDSVEVKDEGVKNGVFLKLTFDIAKGAPEGEYKLLLKVNAYDNDLTPFTVQIQSGGITIKNA